MELACPGQGGCSRCQLPQKVGDEMGQSTQGESEPTSPVLTLVGDGKFIHCRNRSDRPPSKSQGPADWEEGTYWSQGNWVQGLTLSSEAPGALFHSDLSSPAIVGASRLTAGGFFSGKTDQLERKDLQLLKFGSSQQNKQVSAWWLCRELQWALCLVQHSERPNQSPPDSPGSPEWEKIISKPTNTNLALYSSFRENAQKTLSRHSLEILQVRFQTTMTKQIKQVTWILLFPSACISYVYTTL